MSGVSAARVSHEVGSRVSVCERPKDDAGARAIYVMPCALGRALPPPNRSLWKELLAQNAVCVAQL